MYKYIVILVTLAVGEITASLYLAVWRHDFWQAVTDKNLCIFITQLGIFTVVALVYCFLSGMATYVSRITALKWTKRLIDEALPKLHTLKGENLNQRIENDCNEFPDLTITLLFGLTRSIMYIIGFSIAIMYNFAIMYVGVLVIYAVIGSLLTKVIAKPLINMNYTQQSHAATFRNCLTEINFTNLLQISLGIAKKTKYLNYFQTFWGQLSVVLPLIIVAPAYFSTGMSFGSLMQLNGSMGTLLDNLLYPLNTFSQYNRLLSCKKRLKEVGII